MNIANAQALAELLIERHGLDKQGWTIEFDQCVRRLCLLNDESQVENMILHEVAHALVGSRAGHSSHWRSIAVSIGSTGERFYDNEVIRPTRKWSGMCPNCGRTHEARRRGNLACKACCKAFNGGKFTTAYLLQWSENQ